MRKSWLHPHYFGNNSLMETAQYLAFYSLQLPYDYNNETYTGMILNESQAQKIISLFEKRISKRIPVEYITNEAQYLGFKFYVNENVLIPRSLMNARFNDFLKHIYWTNYRVLDLCSGSGCVGITLALLKSNIRVDLLDISEKALDVAKINIERHRLQNRVKCIQGDLFENIDEKYDLIISNPPYVSTKEYEKSPKEFKQEPRIALEASQDGLEIIAQIIEEAKNHLNREGTLIVEVGYSLPRRIKKRYSKASFKWFKYKNHLGKESYFGKPCIFTCLARNLPLA